MNDFLEQLLIKREPERDPRVMIGTWVRSSDKARAQACAEALNISLSAFADRALVAAIQAVEPALEDRTDRA